MFDDLFENITEATATDIRRKQRSINKLFPPFKDRVKAVHDKGGISLKGMDATKLNFKIHSGTKDSVWYDAVLNFKNPEKTLRKLAADRRLWNKDKTKVDTEKLARKFLDKADIELACSCPAQLYWGGDYILSKPKYQAKYGDSEDRPPRIRNPKQYGAHCKHLQNLFMALPLYVTTIKGWIEDFYGDLIEEMEAKTKAEVSKFKKAGRELAKRKKAKEEPKEKPEKEETEPASVSESYTNESGEAGFIYPDGSMSKFDPGDEHQWQIEEHPELRKALQYRIYPAGYWFSELTEDEDILAIRISQPLSSKQIVSLDKVASEYVVGSIQIDVNPPLVDDYIHREIEMTRNWASQVRRLYEEEKEEKRTQESVLEVVDLDVLPAEQQKLATKYKPAKPGDMFKFSDFPGEENVVKFWLLNDGTAIHVQYAHSSVAEKAGVDFEVLLDSGAMRIGSVPDNMLYLELFKNPTIEQLLFIKQLYELHNFEDLYLEGELYGDQQPIELNSSRHLTNVLKHGPYSSESTDREFADMIEERWICRFMN